MQSPAVEQPSKAPVASNTAHDSVGRAQLQVQGPAIGLLVTGILNCLVGTLVAIFMALAILRHATIGRASDTAGVDVVATIVALLAYLACLALGGFVISAALKMKRLEAYGVAITASILAILISPSNVIGLGIGIWSLVVLSRADVAAAFAPRRAQKARPRPATPTQRRLGFAALAIGAAAFLLALRLGGMFHTMWKTVVLSFVLLQVIALACGVAGWRSLAGKIGACLSPLLLLLGMMMLSPSSPDIAGQWSSEQWGQVVLKNTSETEYMGTYSGTVGRQPGEVRLKWSWIERRFNGTWREGEDRFGDLSVRLVGSEIRGALSTDSKSKIDYATPRLADLTWYRSSAVAVSIPPNSPPGNPGGATAAAQATADDDQLSSLPESYNACYLPPVDVNQKAFGGVEVLLATRDRFQSCLLKRADYGLPADASVEQVAAKADQGDLCLISYQGPMANQARLVPLRGAILFPLQLPSIEPESPNWTCVDRLKRMTRSQIAAVGDTFLEEHSGDAEHLVTDVSEGQKYVLVRPDGETYVLSIGKVSQVADGRNRQLALSMVRIGRIPWGTSFRVVDTHGKAVPGATAKFSITEQLVKENGVATYRTHSMGTIRGDAQGCIRLPPLPRGATFGGDVVAPGFLPRKEISGARDKDGHYYPPGVDGKVQLKRPGAIEGRVLDPGGKPLVHAPLSLTTSVKYPSAAFFTANHLRAVTDEQGRFRIDGVPPGEHVLYYPWDGPTHGEVNSGRWRAFGMKKVGSRGELPLPLAGYGLVKPVTVEEATTIPDVVLDFSKSTTAIEGKVLDATGKPVGGASVKLYWPRGDGTNWMSLDMPDTVTDVAGHYRVNHLPPGSFQLQAIPPGMKAAPGNTPAPVQVELAAHQVLQQDLRLAPVAPRTDDSLQRDREGVKASLERAKAEAARLKLPTTPAAARQAASASASPFDISIGPVIERTLSPTDRLHDRCLDLATDKLFDLPEVLSEGGKLAEIKRWAAEKKIDLFAGDALIGTNNLAFLPRPDARGWDDEVLLGTTRRGALPKPLLKRMPGWRSRGKEPRRRRLCRATSFPRRSTSRPAN